MNRRTMLTSLGATALGVSVLAGAASAFAQDATTPPAAAQTQAQTQTARPDGETQRAQAYDDFVAALASELGDDTAAVDAAIRAALIQTVDDRLAAGDIDAERAAAAKAVIQVSDAPLMAGFGGPGGRGGFKGHGGGGGHGGPGFGRDEQGFVPGGPSAAPGVGQAPGASTLPSAPSAPGSTAQGANAPAMTSEGLTS